MKPKTVNSFRGAFTASGIALEFGTADDPVTGVADTEVALSDRIELTPAAARHLAVSLDDALRRSEGIPREGAVASSVAGDRVTPRGRTPVNAPRDPAVETAELLMQRVGALDIPYQYERSFRLARASLLANRFLLTMNRADFGDKALEQCLDIARALAMPVSLQQQVAEPFAEANCVHLGFENGTDGVVCKLYLERSISDDERTAAMARDEALLLHVAFKWSRGGSMSVVTRYFWYPHSPIETIRDRISAIFESGEDSKAATFALHALDVAASRVEAVRLQYLEVLEDENGRRSFDLNVYEASMQVKDLQPGLNNMRDYFDVPRGHFQAIYDQVKLHSLGHIAGGVHRNGEEFFNIYHGVTSFPQFNAELG